MKTLTRDLLNLFKKYPAVFTAIFTYGYYLIVTLDFYEQFKLRQLGSWDFFSHFDTLLWMWLLAFLLVKLLGTKEICTKQNDFIAIQASQLRELERDADGILQRTRVAREQLRRLVDETREMTRSVKNNSLAPDEHDVALHIVEDRLEKIDFAVRKFFPN